MNDRKNILYRAYIFGMLLLLGFVGVGVRLLHIQWYESKAYQDDNIMPYTLPAKPGNLYASDGTLLATSVTRYDVSIDFKFFFEQLPTQEGNDLLVSLSDSLAHIFPTRTASQYLQFLQEQQTKKQRYYPLFNDLGYYELSRLKNLPVFKDRSRYKSGLIVENHNDRVVINNNWKRTIGRVENNRRIGLEGAYIESLKGQDGIELRINAGGKNSRPLLNDQGRVEPLDGYDVITTIDPSLQDVAFTSLLNQMKFYQAKKGSVVVMEVETGEVKALVNLTRINNGNYEDISNYAIGERTEPGSTFKLISLMACLEEGTVDTATYVDTAPGRMKVYDAWVRDSNGRGYGNISMKRAFEVSSNVGVVKLVYNNYKSNPEDFVNRLYKWGLHKPLGIDVQGEKSPLIPYPDDPSWSKLSLPWMAYGYGIEMTPIQLLTFYNAIANQGVMLKPLFLKELKSGGKVVKKYEPVVLNPAMASKETITKAQAMLRSVVTNGTAKVLNTDGYTISGKTGTAQTGYGKGNKQYIASFCGYFPSDKPQYSAIVTIVEPDKTKGYYGTAVAAPVFKDIARHVYVNTPGRTMEDIPIKITEQQRLRSDQSVQHHAKIERMPDLHHKKGGDAIVLLENAGMNVDYSGVGIVKDQSVKAGERIRKGQNIRLVLD